MFSPIKNLLNTKKTKPADAAVPAEAKEAKVKEPKIKAKKAASKGIFLDGDDARGFKSEPAPKPATAKPEKTVKAALAKAAATVAAAAPATPAAPTTTATIAAAVAPAAQPAVSATPYQQFPTRRRPGANMKGFLDMAQQVKKVQS
jgi:hypothetical protein